MFTRPERDYPLQRGAVVSTVSKRRGAVRCRRGRPRRSRGTRVSLITAHSSPIPCAPRLGARDRSARGSLQITEHGIVQADRVSISALDEQTFAQSSGSVLTSTSLFSDGTLLIPPSTRAMKFIVYE